MRNIDTAPWLPERPSEMAWVTLGFSSSERTPWQEKRDNWVALCALVSVVAIAVLLYCEAVSIPVPALVLRIATTIGSIFPKSINYLLASWWASTIALGILLAPFAILSGFKTRSMDEKVVRHYMDTDKPSAKAFTWIWARPRALHLLLQQPGVDLTKQSEVVWHDFSKHSFGTMSLLSKLEDVQKSALPDVLWEVVHKSAVDHYMKKENPNPTATSWIVEHPFAFQHLQQLPDVDLNKVGYIMDYPHTLLSVCLLRNKSDKFLLLWNKVNDETKSLALSHELYRDEEFILLDLLNKDLIKLDTFKEAEQHTFLRNITDKRLLEKLLALGFDINAKNGKGETVLDVLHTPKEKLSLGWITHTRYQSMISLFKEKGAKLASEMG